MKCVRWLTAVLLVALLVSACTGGPSQPEPAKIRFGDTICADCGMIISQPKYASSFAFTEGEGKFKSYPFDDIGDMLAYLRKHAEIMPAGVWVHDYASEEWIDAETAYFVDSPAIKSPMGHGLAAFADRSAAEALATELDGQVLDWDKVRIEHAMADHDH